MNISGGEFKGRKIIAPDEKITRPTLSKVRMSIFNTLYSLIGDFDDKTFLDCFGGSGIMGLEALSRGFESVTVIEKNPKIANVLKKNYQTVSIKPDLFIGDSLKVIPRLNKKYTVAYVDPPYQSGLYENILELLAPISEIIILEHNADLSSVLDKYNIIKQKKYGDKYITFCN